MRWQLAALWGQMQPKVGAGDMGIQKSLDEPSPSGLVGHPSHRVPGSLSPASSTLSQEVSPCTIWGVCCSDVSSWILISGHAGSPDLPASGWGDRVRPGKGGRREPPHWPRGGTKEMQDGWMDGTGVPPPCQVPPLGIFTLNSRPSYPLPSSGPPPPVRGCHTALPCSAPPLPQHS